MRSGLLRKSRPKLKHHLMNSFASFSDRFSSCTEGGASTTAVFGGIATEASNNDGLVDSRIGQHSFNNADGSGPSWFMMWRAMNDLDTLSRDNLLDLYYYMRLNRALEDRLIALYRQS